MHCGISVKICNTHTGRCHVVLGKVLPENDGASLYIEVKSHGTEKEMHDATIGLGRLETLRSGTFAKRLADDSELKRRRASEGEGIMNGKEAAEQVASLATTFFRDGGHGGKKAKSKRGDKLLDLIHTGQMISTAANAKQMEKAMTLTSGADNDDEDE